MAARLRPPYERNEYGGNFAGPIWIPNVYNGKDRSFFFFAYEGFHLTQSSPKSTQEPTNENALGRLQRVPRLQRQLR